MKNLPGDATRKVLVGLFKCIHSPFSRIETQAAGSRQQSFRAR